MDPQNHFSDDEIDLHLPVRPGTDLPLALSLIRIWREQDRLNREFLDGHATHVDALLKACEPWTAEKAAAETGIGGSAIQLLAQRFAETSPAVVRCGWGLERNVNGGQAVAAVLALPALLGKFGVRGGGYTLSNTGATFFDTRRAFGDFEWPTRALNMSRLGRILEGPLDPPVQSLFIYNCNPAVTAPEQNKVLNGLRRPDLFTIVHEQVMTDTARFADLILPATTFLEQREIRRSYGDYKVGGIRPVIPPLGEAWPNHRLFAELGRAFGWDDEPFRWDEDTLFDKIVGAVRMDGASADRRLWPEEEASETTSDRERRSSSGTCSHGRRIGRSI